MLTWVSVALQHCIGQGMCDRPAASALCGADTATGPNPHCPGIAPWLHLGKPAAHSWHGFLPRWLALPGTDLQQHCHTDERLSSQSECHQSCTACMFGSLYSTSSRALTSLQTAFHASFNDPDLADRQSLKISRGTSVVSVPVLVDLTTCANACSQILLLVYGVYLLFQLKSHAYMYESTPQHIVDAEAIPGPAASWLDTSSSESSSDSSSDSDSSSRSRDTMRRKVKKVFRGGRRRKSSVTSIDTVETNGMRNGSFGKENASPNEELASESSSSRPGFSQRISFTDTNTEVAVDDEKPHKRSKRHRLRRHGRKHRKKEQAGDL